MHGRFCCSSLTKHTRSRSHGSLFDRHQSLEEFHVRLCSGSGYCSHHSDDLIWTERIMVLTGLLSSIEPNERT